MAEILSTSRNCAYPGRRNPAPVIAAVLALYVLAHAPAQDREGVPPDAIVPPAWPRSSAIFDAPDPFSLNGYDALQAMALIRRAEFLVRRTGAGRETVVVESLEAVRVDPIEEYPPAHRDRWDLLLNGEPLPWSQMYIEYGGELLSLQLLFTYRNQRPVPDIPYRLDP